MKSNKKYIISLSLIIVLISIVGGIFIFKPHYKTYSLDDVILKHNNSDLFAIYVEEKQGDGTSKYVESKSVSWPLDENHKYNTELSGCVDGSGRPIDGSLKYSSNNNKISLRTNEASLCYLYFDEVVAFAGGTGNDLKKSNQKGLEKSFAGDELEYRFFGANDGVDNYICIATYDKTECILNPEWYEYRIIGITSDGKIKAVKSSPQEKREWHYNDDDDATWWGEGVTSSLAFDYQGIAGILPEPTEWYDNIPNVFWNIGDVEEIKEEAYSSYGEAIAASEKKKKSNEAVQVGLPYLSDIYLGAGLTSDYKTNNWLLDIMSESWTMTRRGMNIDQMNTVWYVNDTKTVVDMIASANGNTHPVVYLNSNVKLTGSGTAVDPFLVVK